MSDDDSYSSFDDTYDSPLLGSRLPHAVNYNSNGHLGNGLTDPPVVILEPPNSYKSRWRSIRIMYMTMFLGCVTFTITVSSLWPFLQVLDSNATPSFLGWVVAAYSLGQLLASPVFGAWANFRSSSREPLVVSLVLTVLFNVLYMYLQSIPHNANLYMIVARGLVGFSAGNVAVVRSYLSAATTLRERTACMANVSIFQALGFILGPVIQTCLVPLGYPGPVEAPSFHLNMYTAPAMFASLLALVNLLLVLFVFKEHKAGALEEAGAASKIQSEDVEQSDEPYSGGGPPHVGNGHAAVLSDPTEEAKPDLIAVLSTIFLFFVVLFMFTVFETIGTPLTMHMYAWTKSQATLYQGIILGSAAACSIAVFIFVKMLAKRFNERYLLLAGFLFSFGAFVIFIPWGTKLSPLAFAPIRNGTRHTTVAPGIHFDDSGHPLVFENHPKDNPVKPNSDNIFSHDIGPIAFKVPSEEYLTRPSQEQPVVDQPKHNSDTFLRNRNPTVINISRPVPSHKQQRWDASSQVASPGLNHASHISSSTLQLKKHQLIDAPSYSKSQDDENSALKTATTLHFWSTKILSAKRSLQLPSNSISGNTTSGSRSPNVVETITPGYWFSTTASPQSINFSTTTASSVQPFSFAPTNRTISPEGCPWQYDWCRHVPVLPLFQYLAGTLVISIGYPMCQMLTYTIYSKILGPKPQGVWMGWITAAGSLARTVGPIYVSQVYDHSGPQVTFGSCACLILITTIFYLVIFRRLVPCKEAGGGRKENGTLDTQHGA